MTHHFRIVTGDQIPDFCFSKDGYLQCREGYYSDSEEYRLMAITDDYRVNIYHPVPEKLTRNPDEPATGRSRFKYNSELKSRLSDFRKIKEKNNTISLSFRFTDINSDGLLDVCFVRDNSINCSVNDGNELTEPTVQIGFSGLLGEYGTNKLQSVFSSINYTDYNADGVLDICLTDGQIHYCAFGEGDTFESFTKVLSITADTEFLKDNSDFYANAIRDLFGEKTYVVNFSAINLYGNKVLTGDNNGDGRVEHCMQTINGIECIDNTQQNYYALLSSVTDSYGNVTKFEYRNTKQLINGENWYHTTHESYPNLVLSTPKSLTLVQMQTDTGLGESGTEFETITYSYSDYYIDPQTMKTSYRSITQKSYLSGKEQITEYYLNPELMGTAKRIIERNSGHLVSETENDYDTFKLYGIDTKRLLQTKNSVFDPSTGIKIRVNTESYESYDSFGYPTVKKERKYLPQTGESKTTKTTTSYHHNDHEWITGRPSKQTVEHLLGTGESITKSVTYDYDLVNGALKKQIFEEGSKYEKVIDFEYYENGLKKSESVTALVDGDNKQTRETTYKYNEIGQRTSLTNPLGHTSKVTYSQYCMAPKEKFDSNDRLLEKNIYDLDTCQLKETHRLSGEVEYFGRNWEDTTIPHHNSGYSENKSLIVSTTRSNRGGMAWEYKDRQGRVIKTVSIVAESGSGTTKSEQISNYNSKGQLIAKSLPTRIESGSSEYVTWVRFGYDQFGRSQYTRAIAPDGSIQDKTWSYQGLTTTETFNGTSKVTTVGVLGKPTAIEKHNKVVHYDYTPLGEVKSVHQNNDLGTKTRIFYDQFGYKKSQEEKATGLWGYRYNGFGELYWQKDSENNVTTTAYDIAGRKKYVRSAEGLSEWAYNNQGHGKGKLSYSISSDGIKRSYVYDHKGRILDEYLHNNGDEISRTHYSYDEIGRLTSKSFNHNSEEPMMSTPLNFKYDGTSNLKAVAIPANKLKSYDFETIRDQYSSSLEQIANMAEQIRTLEQQANYHAKRITFYEAKVQQYSSAKSSLTVETPDLDKAISNHKRLFNTYMKKHRDLLKKAKSYGGLSQARKYRYKGKDKSTGIHTFAYKECTKRVRRLYVFTRCRNYEIGMFGIPDSDFKDLSAKTRSTKTNCRNISRRMQRVCGKGGCSTRPYNTSTKGQSGIWGGTTNKTYEFLSKYTKKIRGGKGGSTTATYHKYEVCDIRNFNSWDIYSELSYKYQVLAEIEKTQIKIKDHDRNAKKTARVSVNKEDGMIENMSRPDAHAYYTAMQNKYQDELDEQRRQRIDLEAELHDRKSDRVVLEEAKQSLLNNIAQLGGLDALEKGFNVHKQLGDKDLILWAALSRDVAGRVKDEMFGNGLVASRTIDDRTKQISNISTAFLDGKELSNVDYHYSADGNLTSKQDSVRSISESYDYVDNQLDSWSLKKDGLLVDERNYSYDEYGNLLSKSDGKVTHEYHQDNVYRLESFNGSNVVYDKRGHAKIINNKHIEWTSFGKARSVSKGQQKVEFRYDASHKRVTKTNARGTTYYVSPSYEMVVLQNGNKIHRYHIHNGYEVTATIERYEYATSTPEGEIDTRIQDHVAYYSRDIIGSGVIVTGSTGQVIKERHYSPYGEEVEMAVQEGAVASNKVIYANSLNTNLIQKHKSNVEMAETALGVPDSKLLGEALFVGNVVESLRGFTSHENLEDVGLIHMNARLYDAEIGRFISPDSIIPDAEQAIGFNRYAYVYNNPALASDPTGNWVWFAVAATYFVTSHAYSDASAHHVASTVLLQVASANTFSGWNAGMVAGGTALVTSAALSGKIGPTEIRSAALAAVSAEVANGLGHGNAGGPITTDTLEMAVYHGLSQGTIGWARNGDFWSGFVSGFVSHGAGTQIQGMITGDSVGAIISRTMLTTGIAAITTSATGGDGVKGALAAAIVHLFNAEGIGRKPSCSGRPCVNRGSGDEPTGVLAIGTEGTAIEGLFGIKGGSGIYYDFAKGKWGYYSEIGGGLSGHRDALAAGVEFQAAITIDYAPSMEYFSGTGVETGYSLGVFGVDYTVVPGKGSYWGIDIGPGIGHSAVKTETRAWSF